MSRKRYLDENRNHVEDVNNLNTEAISDVIKTSSLELEEYKKSFVNSSFVNHVNLRKNLIDEIEPFSSLRKRGYYDSPHYELKFRDIEEDSAKLVFFDHRNHISDIEKFSTDRETDILVQAKKPAKKIFKRLKKELRKNG